MVAEELALLTAPEKVLPDLFMDRAAGVAMACACGQTAPPVWLGGIVAMRITWPLKRLRAPAQGHRTIAVGHGGGANRGEDPPWLECCSSLGRHEVERTLGPHTWGQ